MSQIFKKVGTQFIPVTELAPPFLVENDVVCFNESFGLLQGVVVKDNCIKTGERLWKCEKIDGYWFVTALLV